MPTSQLICSASARGSSLMRQSAVVGRSVAAAVLLVASADLASAQLMAPAGKFEVSPGGAATYSFSVAVPPGTAGLKPTLTLEYNSQNRDGIVGVGWALGGLPAITRCPRTMIQNGVVGAINFDANDRFCLEGHQITAISGAYGADGTEYRTEIETFSRIISRGTAGAGPAWFEVRTKSGQILQLGNTADSRPLTASGTARSWVLNRLSDTKGNYLTVTYTNDAANGQIYPLRIDYTGNAAAGLAPYNSVLFEYATRPDIAPLYHAGVLMKTTVRLTNIKTVSGTTLVSDYRLAYDQSPSSLRSRVTSITLCAGDGACMPATSFAWTNGGATTFTYSAYTHPWTLGTSPHGRGWNLLSGDFNNDGRTDLGFETHAISDSTFRSLRSNGDGTFTAREYVNPLGGSGVVNFLGGDFNGDGRPDYTVGRLGSSALPAEFRTYLAGTDGSFGTPVIGPTTGGSSDSGPRFTGDVNGDGRADISIVWRNKLHRYVAVGGGSFSYSMQTLPSDYGNTSSWQLEIGDFNGDGLIDFLLQNLSNNLIHTYLSNVDGTVTRVVQTTSFDVIVGGSWKRQAGDVNGDGKTDLVFVGSNILKTFVSKGDGTFAEVSQTLSLNLQDYEFTFLVLTAIPAVIDFNRDGRADFTLVKNSTAFMLLSKGDGSFIESIQNLGFDLGSQPTSIRTPFGGDFNGDGLPDLAFVGSTDVRLFTNNASVPDLLLSITTGLGATTSITYAPLTQSAVYTKDSNAVYPTVDLIGGVHVVSRVDTANGIGGTYSTAYSYAGAKSDTRGRFLGFRQVRVQDLQTNIVQTTSFRQDFPFIGMPVSVTKALGAQTLNQATTTYQFSNASGAATVSTPTITSAPYRVSVGQTVTSSSDLDGSAMPTVTTSYQYDAFGNATQVVASTPDGFSKITTNTYTNDTTNWFLGRLTGASVLSTTP
jgi:hypothetical protein